MLSDSVKCQQCHCNPQATELFAEDLSTLSVLLTKSLGKSANQSCNVTAETEQQTAQASELLPLAEVNFPFFLSSFFKVHFTFDTYQHL